MEQTKVITYSKEGREHLKNGIDKVANSVKVTLGAKGRNVIIDREPFPHVTKDGVTVAAEINLEHPIENMGAKLIKQVAMQTAKDSGDGTTSSTVLAQEFITRGLDSINEGFNAIEVKKGMDMAVNEVVTKLRTKAKDISAEFNILKQVAVISANGDEEVGNIVADVMSKIKLDGDVTVELADTDKTYSVITEGTKLVGGYINQYYVTNHATMTAEYTNALVFLYDGALTTIPDVEPIFKAYQELVVNNGGEKIPLVIIASNIDGEALSSFTINKAKGILPCVTLRLHGTPFDKTQTLNDLQSVVGGSIINQTTGLMMKDFTKEMFGQTRKIVVNDKNSIIMSSSFGDTMNERIEQLKNQIKAADNDEIKKIELRGRIARLIGGIAVIYVGGKTEAEVFEKKDRIDDAIGATKAAMAEGVIAGGGVALLRASKMIESLGKNKDQQRGIEIIRESLDAPIYQILENGGYEMEAADDIILPLLKKDFNIGFDIKNEVEVDMVKQGIIDPFKVVRNCIENANSIAGLILTTECVINNK